MIDDTETPDDETADEVGDDMKQDMDAILEGAAGLFETLKDIFVKSKDEVVRSARLGKARIDLFQVEKDREHFLQRLGEECYELMLAGKVSHPDLEKPFLKIKALDEKRGEYEGEVERMSQEQLEATSEDDAANEGPDDEPEDAAADSAAQAAEPAPEPKPKKTTAKAPAKKAAAKKSPAKKAPKKGTEKKDL